MSSPRHLAQLRNDITSPGGTTAAALWVACHSLLLFCCGCEEYLLNYALVSWGALVVRYVFFFGVVSLGYCFAVDSLCDFGTIISALRTICATHYAMLPIFKPC